jgi:hypothetical protein
MGKNKNNNSGGDELRVAGGGVSKKKQKAAAPGSNAGVGPSTACCSLYHAVSKK